jgi:pilus assembly protein CpaB
MSNITKIAAIALLLVALALGYAAWRIAVRPPPPAPAAPVAQHHEPARPTLPVVVAAKAIPAGSKIDAAELSVQNWPVAPTGGYAQPGPVLGQITRVALAAGEPVTTNTLAQGLARYLKPGERAVAIAVDEIIGATNRIEPGDRVDVFVTMERNQEITGTQSRLLQSRVRVLAYGMQSVDGPTTADAKGTPAPRAGNAPLPRNAMLAVPVEQVNELLLAARNGRLQLVLRAPDDEDVPDPSLFPVRVPVLSARSGLTTAQKEEAGDGVNAAFAGDSLPQLAGSVAPAAAVAAAQPPRAAAPRHVGGGGRSVEVIRGGHSDTVSY